MINLKKQLLSIALGVTYFILIAITISLFQFDTFQVWFFLVIIRAIIMLYKNNFSIENLVKSTLLLAGIITMFVYLSNFGTTGYILGLILLPIYIIAMRWEKYIEVKHQIETIIWKQPLHTFKQQGEKIPKLKLEL